MKALGLFLLLSIILTKRTITTVAGGHNSEHTGTNGPATDAAVMKPNQVTIDKLGNIYIAECGNNVVRRINSDGVISLAAGNYKRGYSGDGGMAIAAGLSAPADVAIDKFGNLYIADMWNNRIRKINALGIISTFAGIGEAGFSGDGDPAVKARLKDPVAIIFDRNNNLLIVERANSCVRKVSPAGTITTIAGGSEGFSGDGGAAANALLNNPTDIAIDSRNNIYIADDGNNRIRKIDVSGRISTFAGTGVPGFGEDGTRATDCKLFHPYGLFIDNKDNVYFSDNANSVIRKIDAKGVVTTLAGTVGKPGFSGDGGPALKCQINNPGGLAIDNSGNLFIADYGNNAVRKIPNVLTR